jgi:probable F420-dependent oxidoreductase
VSLGFGLGLPVVQQLPGRGQDWERDAGGEELARIARAADRLGFAHVSCSDHVLVPRSRAGAMGTQWYDVAATLGYLAGVTRRVRLLAHVVVLPYRHPLLTAKTFGTLDRLSGGRVILGVGSGHLKPEFRTLGVPYEQRGKRTDEYIRAIRAAWGSEVASFAGDLVEFRDVIVAPRPIPRPGGSDAPSIWIGGNGPAAVRRAAALGDGWIPWQVSVERFAALVARARTLAVAAGRADPLEFVAPLAVARADDAGAVLGCVESWRKAGATGFHVGLAHRSLDELLERMAWFADGVLARSS